jgi:transposase
MPAPLSSDLRQRFEALVLSGLTGAEAARRLMVSPATGARLARKVREGGSLQPRKCGCLLGWGKLGPYKALLAGWVEQDPDITLAELCRALAAAEGVRVSQGALCRALRRMGFTFKKKSLVADERRRAAVTRARHDWTSRRQPLMRESPERLVFIDETSVKTNMTRPRGRARKGRRLHARAPAGLWNTQTFIAV